MYGKVLSIPDRLIYRYFELASDAPTQDLPRLKTFAQENPRDAKHELALTIVRMYHGEEAAQAARAYFEQTVIRKEIPDEMPVFQPAPPEGSRIGLLELMTQAGLTKSNGEARRMVQQMAVSIDGEKVSDFRLEIDLSTRTPFVLKVGKRRFARIVWNGDD